MLERSPCMKPRNGTGKLKTLKKRSLTRGMREKR
jgi:hypothetical protein